VKFLLALCALNLQAAVFDVTAFGAKGDGKTPNRDAIRKAIETAAAAGGGTVYFPAGTYVTGSIQLRSNIALQFEPGATLEASADKTAYDDAEPNQWTQFQDFGHSHWHNSLIWGEGLENISIIGPGLISGKALGRGDARGIGDKAIALKLCHNVTLRDFSILNGGHFGILATGVDNLTIDNLKIDTNRDGIDVDGSRNVRISNSSVNSPNDVAKQPADKVNTFFFRGGVPPREPYATPEREKEYPEPSMFGMMPAYGFFIRHAKGIQMTDVNIGTMTEDRRPPFVLEDVKGIEFSHVQAQKADGVPSFVLMNVENLSIDHCAPVADTQAAKITRKEI
jgi:hypothetical protein